MPTLSMFYGIIIRMFFDDHNPPHFHAEYQGFKGVFDLEGELIEGDIPLKQCKLITAWAQIHNDELKGNWVLAKQDEPLYKIEPLK